MAKIIINDKYIIDNVDFNDHMLSPSPDIIAECYMRMPTDKEIGIIVRFEEEIGHI